MQIPDWLLYVVEEIEDNITNCITLDELANKAGFSLRHLQRQFKAIAKENLGDYIRGRRLTLAMSEVISSDKSILDIALEYGFQSQEAFTRAFQARFVFSPRRFRLRKVDNPITLRTKIDVDYLQVVNSGALTLEPEIKTLGAMIFVGIGGSVDENSFQSPAWGQTIISLFDQLRELSFEGKPISESSFLISYSNKQLNQSGSSDIRMLAARKFNEEAVVPAGSEKFIAPGGLYAGFQFTGRVEQLFRRGNYLLGTWLPNSGYWLGNAPAIVKMDMDYEIKRLTVNSWIPLRQRRLRTVDSWWE